MTDRVKVRIKEGYTGHHHRGREVEPGEVIEVLPRQAAWLHELGAIEPVPKEEAPVEKGPEPTEETTTTEGAEETPEA